MRNLENYSDFRDKVFPCLEGKDINGLGSQVLIDFIVEGSKERDPWLYSHWLHNLMCDFGMKNLRRKTY